MAPLTWHAPEGNKSDCACETGNIAKEDKRIARLCNGMKDFQDSHPRKAGGNRLKPVIRCALACQQEHGSHGDRG
jgi:hypothetical protein